VTERDEPSFLVQALDNVGDDLTSIAGWVTSRKDSHEKAVIRLRESINDVGVKAVEQPMQTEGSRLRVHRGLFNLELDLGLRDAAGRRVAVLCHARVPQRQDVRWPAAMSWRLDRFLEQNELPVARQAPRAFAETKLLTTTSSFARSVGAYLFRILARLGLEPLWRETIAMPPDAPDPFAESRLLVFVGPGGSDALGASLEGKGLVRDPSAGVVEYPVAPDVLDASPILKRLHGRGDLDANAVLVLHPHFPGRFVQVAEFGDAVALSKIRITTDLCRRLGASRVSVEEATVDSSAGEAKWSATAGNETADASVAVESSHLEELMRSVETHDVYDGGPPNVESARELLRAHGLEDDEEFCELIALRQGENPLRSRTIQVRTRTEVAKAKGLVAKVRVALPKVGVEVETSSREMRSYFFKLTVEFPA
jgi:hypothetical protein